MTTKKQVFANQRNALRATGPRTEDGKRAVRHNALKHGIRSADVLLPDESYEDYSQFKRSLWDYKKPVGPVEEEETRKLVDFAWRLRRCAKIDAGTFENLLRDQKPGMNKLALAFATGAVAFSNLARYEGHLSRQYVMTLRELERLQAARAAKPISPPPASDIDIGLTVDEQVDDAVLDFEARREESEGLNRSRLLEQLLPKSTKSNRKHPTGGPHDN